MLKRVEKRISGITSSTIPIARQMEVWSGNTITKLPPIPSAICPIVFPIMSSVSTYPVLFAVAENNLHRSANRLSRAKSLFSNVVKAQMPNSFRHPQFAIKGNYPELSKNS